MTTSEENESIVTLKKRVIVAMLIMSVLQIILGIAIVWMTL